VIANYARLGILPLANYPNIDSRSILMPADVTLDLEVAVSTTAHYAAVTERWTGGIVVFDLKSNSILSKPPRTDVWDTQLQFSPTTDELAIPRAKRIDLDNLATQESRSIDYESTQNVIAWSPDGKWLAVADAESVAIFNAASGEREQLFSHSGTRAVAFSGDGQSLATGGSEGVLTVWDWKNGKVAWTAHPRGGYAIPWIYPTLGLLALLLIAGRSAHLREMNARRPS